MNHIWTKFLERAKALSEKAAQRREINDPASANMSEVGPDDSRYHGRQISGFKGSRWTRPGSDPIDPNAIPRVNISDINSTRCYSVEPFHGDFASCTSSLQKARLAWSLAFIRTPYASFLMIDDSLHTARITYNQWLKEPNLILEIIRGNDDLLHMATQRESNVSLPSSEGVAVTSSRTRQRRLGRYTSFAVEIVEELSQSCPGEFEFEYFDLRSTGGSGGHHVAICCKTGVYIDSTTNEGPMILENGKQQSYEEPSGRLKLCYDDNYSKRIRPNGTEASNFPRLPFDKG